MLDAFDQKKQSILEEISSNSAENLDLSPKGTIDVDIIPLLTQINQLKDYVTLSSCSGRVSVFLEGEKGAKAGGKGLGGKWLFISHEEPAVWGPWWSEIKGYREADDGQSRQATQETFNAGAVYGEGSGRKEEGDVSNDSQSYEQSSEGDTIGITSDTRFLLYKFEPMILHVKARDFPSASRLFTAAMNTGFRESGIGSNHVVAIRTSMRIEMPIGHVDTNTHSIQPLVSDHYIQKVLIPLSSEMFKKNTEKMAKLMAAIAGAEPGQGQGPGSAVPETKEQRRLRKRREGLALKAQKEQSKETTLQ